MLLVCLFLLTMLHSLVGEPDDDSLVSFNLNIKRPTGNLFGVGGGLGKPFLLNLKIPRILALKLSNKGTFISGQGFNIFQPVTSLLRLFGVDFQTQQNNTTLILQEDQVYSENPIYYDNRQEEKDK